jgi:hypothetical protein
MLATLAGTHKSSSRNNHIIIKCGVLAHMRLASMYESGLKRSLPEFALTPTSITRTDAFLEPQILSM